MSRRSLSLSLVVLDGQLEDYLDVQKNISVRPNITISIGPPPICRPPQFNGRLTILVGFPLIGMFRWPVEPSIEEPIPRDDEM